MPISPHWLWVTVALGVSPCFSPRVTISYSFWSQWSQWVFRFFWCLHYVGCCYASLPSDFNIMKNKFIVIVIFFLLLLFFFLHGYSVVYTCPRTGHTDSHTRAGTYIHLRAHMVAFILSTPQSASCGTTCLGWERGGPETNRMSRGVWTVTVARKTFIEGSATHGR